jgi:signal transduction histidine kinase
MIMAMSLSALGGGGLAVLLWRQGDTAVGSKPLAAFVAVVGVWSIGLLLPNRLGEALMALAPVGGAVFVHFTARLTGRGATGIAWAYGLGFLAMAIALTVGAGRFVPWPGGALFRYEKAGLLAGVVTVGLAAFGHRLLVMALRQADGIERRQIMLVLLSSVLGLLSVAGLSFPLLGIESTPWPLLLQPLYLVVLAYAVLRYRLMAVNRWAVRAVCWGLLIGLAGVVSAVSAGLAAKQVGVSFVWTAIALLAGLTLAGPARRLADRIVYPGGEVTADDLARWRQDLSETDDETQLNAKAACLLRHHLGLSDDSALNEFAQAPPGPRRVAGVMAELVEQAKADLARRHAFAERQRLAELGALAATVAHDLRNPMNIVAMAVADAPPDTRGEVKAQLMRMETLVRDLLDYAKPWRVDTAMVDLASLLAGFSVDSEVPSGLTVNADPGRLRQVLANLLDNARVAGGRVLAVAEQRPDSVLIHICDDGPGIPEDIRASLFQPFVSRSPGGTGLGLALVAKAMAAHGGSVTLETRPGWTTCFSLRFPL